MISSFFLYVFSALMATFTQIFALLGPGLILAGISQLFSNFVWTNAIQVLGWKKFAYIFGLVGIPVHEIGHAIFNLLFGHKITEISFFEPNNTEHSGHVAYVYNPGSIYQNIGIFFSAIGPIILGSLVIYLASILLFGDQIANSLKSVVISSESFSSFSQTMGMIPNIYHAAITGMGVLFNLHNFLDWKFYVFIYLVFSIGSSMNLSPADLKNALTGFLYFFVVLLIFNFVTLWIGSFAYKFFLLVGRYFINFYAVMIFVIILNLIAGLTFLSIHWATRTIRKTARN